MNCPYCFQDFKSLKKQRNNRLVYCCQNCDSEIHRAYVEFPNVPVTRIGLVGYTGHGKTVFISSLFYQLQSMDTMWDKFYFETLDDFTHEIMYNKVPQLKSGKLFSGTPINFPEPAFIRLNKMPYFDTQIISLYDIGGGVFDDLDLMTEKGKYLAHSDTIFFIISLLEEDVVEDWNLKIMALLDRYIYVVYSRFGKALAKEQNITFVITKADELIGKTNGKALTEDLENHINTGTCEKYRHLYQHSVEEIKYSSDFIEEWLRKKGCNSFINMAESHFKTVSFVMVSALGNAPVNNELSGILKPTDPKRVLDPLLYAMNLNFKKKKRKKWFFF